MSIFNSQEPLCCSPNCLRLVWGQSKSRYFAHTMCKMFEAHILVAEALTRNPEDVPGNICLLCSER